MRGLASVSLGSGPPLVILHGLGGSRRLTVAIFNEHRRVQGTLFSERYRVIAVDLPGHGQSAPFDWRKTDELIGDIAHAVVEELERLGVHRFALVGVSLGGTVGLEIASRYPEKVTALVLQGAPYRGREFPWYQRYPMAALQLVLRIIGHTRFAQWISQWIFDHVRPQYRESFDPRLLPILEADRREVNVLFWLAAAYAILTYDSRKKIKGLDPNIPVLLIDGEKASYFPVATTQRLGRLIPWAEVVLVENAGHYLPYQDPSAFTRHVLDFLERHGVS